VKRGYPGEWEENIEKGTHIKREKIAVTKFEMERGVVKGLLQDYDDNPLMRRWTWGLSCSGQIWRRNKKKKWGIRGHCSCG